MVVKNFLGNIIYSIVVYCTSTVIFLKEIRSDLSYVGRKNYTQDINFIYEGLSNLIHSSRILEGRESLNINTAAL